MSWLWRYYRRDGLYHVDWTPWAPALESGCDTRAINVLQRFAEIFEPLGNAAIRDNIHLEDVLLRTLALLDLSCGLDSRQVDIQRLDRELRAGLWGDNVRKYYAYLDTRERLELLNLLHEQSKSRLLFLDRAIAIFFPHTAAYKIEKNGAIILSISQAKTPQASARLALVLALFLPLAQEIRVYWQKTPCLLDEPEGRADYCMLG